MSTIMAAAVATIIATPVVVITSPVSTIASSITTVSPTVATIATAEAWWTLLVLFVLFLDVLDEVFAEFLGFFDHLRIRPTMLKSVIDVV
jgi:hypothetical protein